MPALDKKNLALNSKMAATSTESKRSKRLHLPNTMNRAGFLMVVNGNHQPSGVITENVRYYLKQEEPAKTCW
jgi:hypothetical protein